ncbi:MAG TPA: nucleotidyltransferase family protein [Pyrinomonadaceae bacterium]
MARAELNEEQCERLRASVAGSFDWDYFYRLTRRHSLVPLAYRQLEHSIKDIVPPDILQQFRKDHQENAARNLIFVDELASLLDAFARTGIEAILFKGPRCAGGI